MKKISVILSITFLTVMGSLKANPVDSLYRDSFRMIQSLCNDKGVYRDARRFAGEDYHPASTAAIGVGLVALCIGDRMQWIDDGRDQVIQTLEAMAGKDTSFQPDRNAGGVFRHWMNMETGAREWNSEYSSIDCAILVSGALFAARYFKDPAIDSLAVNLFSSVDWNKMIADPITGGIYREMDEDGNGIPGAITTPYSEYIIVAWLCKNAEGEAGGPATELWNSHYADPDDLIKTDYGGKLLLSDNPNAYLSNFTMLLPYYFCNYVTVSPAYEKYIQNARQADSLYWANQSRGDKHYIWGLGAGAAEVASGYSADNFGNNPNKIYSPHIIGGFLPLYSKGIEDISRLISDGLCLYEFQSENIKVLWRRSLLNPSWKAQDIQVIDYSTMLFGLAAYYLGVDFFSENNNFWNQKGKISAIPDKLVYGEIFVDSASSKDFTIYNTGKTSLTINDISTADSIIFNIAPYASQINSGDSSVVSVVFRPRAVQSYLDTISILNSDSTAKIILSGKGISLPVYHSSSGNQTFTDSSGYYNIWVKLNAPTSFQNVIMIFSEKEYADWDTLFCSLNQDRFSCSLKACPYGTVLKYYFETTDTNGHLVRLPADAPLDTYEIKVLDFLPGDVNNNGKVDIYDLLELLNQLAGRSEKNRYGDVDGNSKIDIFDLLELLKVLASS